MVSDRRDLRRAGVVKYVAEEALGLPGAFGRADMRRGIAYVRNDLPECVQRFVRAHELYHLGDEAKWWVWREIKANLVGAWHEPWGFAVCVLMSLSLRRLRFYWWRIKKRE